MLNLLHSATELLFQSYETLLYLVTEYASVEITNIKTKQIIILFVKLSRASRARLKAVAMRKGCFQKLLALRLSTGDWLVLYGGEEGERARRVFF
jgi:hypothetical protein